MNKIRLGDLCAVVKNLPDGKAAGLLGVSNELWKHSGNLVLGCLLNLLNSCLMYGNVLALWKCTWISIIPKPYEWEEFLKDTSTQLPVFVIGLIIKNALEKSRELWMVLQDMWKAYDSVLDRLDQNEVFSPLLWRIFYDPLLCEIKSQEHLCGYRIDLRFVAKSGRVESQAEITSFFTAGAFVDDTIWVGSSQAATQCILDVASEFFVLNNISINTEKTVTILFNQKVKDIFLTISDTPIAVAKKGESHHYLGIFLSMKGLSKPSLLKVHSDVHFFSNVVLRKAIFDKQFCYLVSSVLQPIISYRIQFSFISSAICFRWNAIIRRGLKFKAHLLRDFLMIALLHPSFYGVKTFAQVQSESKSLSIINFVNAPDILG
ncbi:hypothetical protein G9A89_001714 [Geosiphon pyriformis]|nr:hypothetical protein G9A89_001714 [Geosiphon pyriformis]